LADDAAAQTAWAPGIHAVSVLVKQGADLRVTNQVPLSLAPKVGGIAPPNPVARDAAGDATLTFTCGPQVRPTQRAVLILGDREVEAQAHPTATATLTFTLTAAPVVTSALARLRVDGVESLPFKRVAVPPPPRLEFDDAQKVTIT
jgi:hypothetical protein